MFVPTLFQLFLALNFQCFKSVTLILKIKRFQTTYDGNTDSNPAQDDALFTRKIQALNKLSALWLGLFLWLVQNCSR